MINWGCEETDGNVGFNEEEMVEFQILRTEQKIAEL